jgi:hypothetical protein
MAGCVNGWLMAGCVNGAVSAASHDGGGWWQRLPFGLDSMHHTHTPMLLHCRQRSNRRNTTWRLTSPDAAPRNVQKRHPPKPALPLWVDAKYRNAIRQALPHNFLPQASKACAAGSRWD